MTIEIDFEKKEEKPMREVKRLYQVNADRRRESQLLSPQDLERERESGSSRVYLCLNRKGKNRVSAI